MTPRQRAFFFAILTVVELGWCIGLSAQEFLRGGGSGGAGVSQNVGVIGNAIGQQPGQLLPCDQPGVTCLAAWSMSRIMRTGYSGPLFRLTRTSDNANQDIGVASGVADQATINAFCNNSAGTFPGSFGRNTTTVNGCQPTKIYNQGTTGSANDMVGLNPAYASCYVRYAQDASKRPMWITDTVVNNHCFMGVQTPTGLPTGNDPISIYLVANDALWPVEESSFGYTGVFGMVHHTDDGGFVCCGDGTDYTLGGGGGYSNSGSVGSSDYISMRLDTENDIGDLALAPADHTAAEAALSPNLATFGYVGDWAGFTSWEPGTRLIQMDWMSGRRSKTITYTGSTGRTVMNMGGDLNNVAHLAEVRMGWTGDSTGYCPIAFHEGAIMKATLDVTVGRAMEASGMSFYGITAPVPCTNANIGLLGGRDVVTGALGIAQLDATRFGGTVVIARADTGALKALGTVNGTCNPDVSGVAAFCSGTTCRAWDIPNQVIPNGLSRFGGWAGSPSTNLFPDTKRFLSASAGAGPTFVLNALNSLPVFQCGGSDLLTSEGSANAITRPFTIAGAAKRTATAGSLFQDGGGTNLFHDSASANTFRVRSSSAVQTATANDGTWFSVGGTVVGGVVKAYVNGTPQTSGAQTTSDTASDSYKICNGWTGQWKEIVFTNGNDAGDTALSNFSAAERADGNF